MARQKPWTNTTVPKDPRLQVYKEVYLVNEGTETYKEKVKGDWIIIEPGDAWRGPRHEAASIRGKFCGDGVKKQLKIYPIFQTATEAGIGSSYVCQLDGKTFDSQEDLDKHLEVLRKKVK